MTVGHQWLNVAYRPRYPEHRKNVTNRTKTAHYKAKLLEIGEYTYTTKLCMWFKVDDIHVNKSKQAKQMEALKADS